jgi:hypothetical protein
MIAVRGVCCAGREMAMMSATSSIARLWLVGAKRRGGANYCACVRCRAAPRAGLLWHGVLGACGLVAAPCCALLVYSMCGAVLCCAVLCQKGCAVALDRAWHSTDWTPSAVMCAVLCCAHVSVIPYCVVYSCDAMPQSWIRWSDRNVIRCLSCPAGAPHPAVLTQQCR